VHAVHALFAEAAIEAEYVPASQTTQAAAAEALPHDPGQHGWHEANEGAPASGLQRPAPHGVHVAARASLHVPGGHIVHVAAAFELFVPAQAVHCIAARPLHVPGYIHATASHGLICMIVTVSIRSCQSHCLSHTQVARGITRRTDTEISVH